MKQDDEGYASIYIPPPPLLATQQQLRGLQHPVPPPKRRRLNPSGGPQGTVLEVPGRDYMDIYDPAAGLECPSGNPVLGAMTEEHNRTGVG